MSIIQGTAKGGSTSFYDFPVEQSLRFDGTSSYLSRTPTTAGNRRTWTWSGWVKRGNLNINGATFQQIFSAGNGPDASNRDVFFFDTDTDDTICFYTTSGALLVFRTNAVYRDCSSWYHIVLRWDSTQATESDRIRLYVNGVLQTFNTVTYPTPNAELAFINTTSAHYLGTHPPISQYLDGYLANLQFIDGQALDASYFGETKDDIWVPKTFDGTSSTGGSTVSTDYGTNGFLLDFSSISGTTINDTAPIDTNHSSANNWTATGF